jgi:hypothetical protein
MDAHKNFAYSTIATAPSPATSGTSLAVQAGDGAKFPSGSFNATVWPANVMPTDANAEIVRCTVSGDTLTITRAQEGSSARSIGVGDQIAATITAKTLTDVEGAVTAEATSRATGDAEAVSTAEAYTDAGLAAHVAASDPHTQYQKESEKGQASGYASLDGSGLVPDAQIPSAIARDSEVTAAVAAEATARDTAIATAIANLINGAPGALDTLKELADAINDDASFAASVTTALAGKVASSLYDANTILKADSDDTPAALTMGASTILARLASGGIVAATPAQLRTLLSLVVGTDVQAHDADLDTYAGITPTAIAQSILAAANAAAVKTLLSLVASDVGLGSVTNDAQLKASQLDTDGTLSANSDTRVPSQKAVKTYADGVVRAAHALEFQGAQDCSANPNYPAATLGDLYIVSVAGKIGGASGVSVEAGDMFTAIATNAGGTQAAVGSSWAVIQTNLVGAVLNTRQITAGTGLSGGGDLSADRTISLPNTGPGASGPIGDSTHVAAVTIDAQGRVTALSSVAIAAGSADKLGLTPTAVKTSGYTAAAGDFVPVDTSSGAVTITLPNAPADGSVVEIKLIKQSSNNAVTIACQGSDVFNIASGVTSAKLPFLHQSILLQYKSSSAIWYVVSDSVPPSARQSIQLPGLIAPIDPRLFNSTTTPGANGMVGVRVTIPYSGTLHDLAVYITASAGNLDIGIIDTTVTTRNRLYHSGAIASPGTGWRILADPNLAVNAGDQLDLVLSTDSNSSIFAAAVLAVQNALPQLPSAFHVSPLGGLPILSWFTGSVGSTIPSTIAESSITANQKTTAIICRIS